MFCWPRNTENVPATSYTETLRYQREDATQLQSFHTHHSSHVSFCLSKGTRSKEVNCIADSKGTKMSKCFYYTWILILASTIFACEDRHTARSDNWFFKKCYPDASSWPIYTYWTNFLRLPCTYIHSKMNKNKHLFYCWRVVVKTVELWILKIQTHVLNTFVQLELELSWN